MEWFTSTNDLHDRDDGIPRGTIGVWEGGKEKCVQCIYPFLLFWLYFSVQCWIRCMRLGLSLESCFIVCN
jgi:hypothetical protein